MAVYVSITLRKRKVIFIQILFKNSPIYRLKLSILKMIEYTKKSVFIFAKIRAYSSLFDVFSEEKMI